MCKGSDSGTNTVTQNSAPPANVSAAYDSLLGRATQVASQPLQLYGGPMVAGFTPDQLSAMNTVRQSQGVASPYINAASDLYSAGSAPLSLTPFSSSGVSQYMNPYTQNVVDATQAQFNNQNAQQRQQNDSNSITKGAWGGDRAGVADAILAGQQQLAQAPTIAGLYNQNYAQGLQEFNTQQQQNLAAQQGSGWLAQNAGFGLAGLGNEAQNTTLGGASAQLSSGALQQQLAQEGINIPYQQFQQIQAYPYQQTGWLGGITEGLGSAAGGTGSSTYPGASMLGQVAGLGLTGLGAYGLARNAGLFSSAASAGGSSLNAGDVASTYGQSGADIPGFFRYGGPVRRQHRSMGGLSIGDDNGSITAYGLPGVPDASKGFITSPQFGHGKGPPGAPGVPNQDDPMGAGAHNVEMASSISGLLKQDRERRPGAFSGGVQQAPSSWSSMFSGSYQGPHGVTVPVLGQPPAGGGGGSAPPAYNPNSFMPTSYYIPPTAQQIQSMGIPIQTTGTTSGTSSQSGPSSPSSPSSPGSTTSAPSPSISTHHGGWTTDSNSSGTGSAAGPASQSTSTGLNAGTTLGAIGSIGGLLGGVPGPGLALGSIGTAADIGHANDLAESLGLQGNLGFTDAINAMISNSTFGLAGTSVAQALANVNGMDPADISALAAAVAHANDVSDVQAEINGLPGVNGFGGPGTPGSGLGANGVGLGDAISSPGASFSGPNSTHGTLGDPGLGPAAPNAAPTEEPATETETELAEAAPADDTGEGDDGGDDGGDGGGDDKRGGRVMRAYGGELEAAGGLNAGGPEVNPMATQQQDRYAKMSEEQLQELAVRTPQMTPDGRAIRRALQSKRMQPQSGAMTAPPGAMSTGAFTPPPLTANYALAGLATGGRAHFADGGMPEFSTDMTQADILAGEPSGALTPYLTNPAYSPTLVRREMEKRRAAEPKIVLDANEMMPGSSAPAARGENHALKRRAEEATPWTDLGRGIAAPVIGAYNWATQPNVSKGTARSPGPRGGTSARDVVSGDAPPAPSATEFKPPQTPEAMRERTELTNEGQQRRAIGIEDESSLGNRGLPAAAQQQIAPVSQQITAPPSMLPQPPQPAPGRPVSEQVAQDAGHTAAELGKVAAEAPKAAMQAYKPASSPIDFTAPHTAAVVPQPSTISKVASSAYLPILVAGLGTLANRSPNAGNRIGAGALEGVKMLQSQEATERDDRKQAAAQAHQTADLDLRAKQLTELAGYHRDELARATARDLADAEAKKSAEAHARATEQQARDALGIHSTYVGLNDAGKPVFVDPATKKTWVGDDSVANPAKGGHSPLAAKSALLRIAHPDWNEQQIAAEVASGKGKVFSNAEIEKFAEQEARSRYHEDFLNNKTKLSVDDYIRQYKPMLAASMHQANGSAAGTAATPQPGAGAAATPSAPPDAAIEYLKKNPGMAKDFDAKYGAGASAQYLNPT